MKLRMYASIIWSQWNPRFYNDGVKAGEIDGYSRDEPAILVQCKPFPMGTPFGEKTGHVVIIEFMKEVSQILIDPDDGCELIENGMFPEDAKNYEGLDEDFDTEDFVMYGSCVKEILHDEIVGLHYGVWDEDRKGFMFDGKMI